MKDESKAKWPDDMTALRIHNSYRISGENEWVATVNSIERNEALEARARQVRYLPKMVALLKRVATENNHVIRRYYDGRGDVPELTENAKAAKALLHDIGEVE